jgi:glycerol-3-phosphate dehydrogenase
MIKPLRERQGVKRDRLLSKLDETEIWDFLVIGGGATGLGVALEATTRGYRTLLVEQSDFCKGTSSKSTKLIHGGVRYLRQGNLTLVMEALRERGRLLKNAERIVRPLPLIIPVFNRWQKLYYTAGLTVYDLLAGKRNLDRSKALSASEIRKAVPALEGRDLAGGVLFYDAQFDEARLAIALARTCADQGGTLINYMRVVSLLRSGTRVNGALVEDQFTGIQREFMAKAIVNCTGAFSDQLRKLADDDEELVSASQGSHVVLDRSFLAESECGVLIPKTDDGRILFAIPWMDRVVAGTTDVPVHEIQLDPRPSSEEIEFILSHLGRYFVKKPTPPDLLSVFAGIRPLVRSKGPTSTVSLSRDHEVIVSPTGMISVIGGKWTTYRKMGEDGVDRAVSISGLEPRRQSTTKALTLHEWDPSEEGNLALLVSETPSLAEPLHKSAPYRMVDVVRAIREEWACTLEDVMARRTRMLILDARASLEAAPRVASLMAKELQLDQRWQEEQLRAYEETVVGYLPSI